VTLAVSLVYGLDRMEEALVVGRVDLVQIDDRHQAAGLEDCCGTIKLRRTAEPVVGGGREQGVLAVVWNLEVLKVADGHAKVVRRQVGPESGRHGGPYLDRVDYGDATKEVARCLAGAGADLKDARTGREEIEQVVE
jgi:hypothetical protein